MALLLNAGDTVSRSYSYTQPSPLHPSMPNGTGDMSSNLVESYLVGCNINASGSLISNPDFNMFLAKVEQGKTYCADATLLGGYFYDKPTIGSISYDGQRLVFVSSPFTAPIDGYLAFRKASTETTAMMNEGNELLPYQPYGYKIPISNGSATTIVSLGETQSTRAVKKLVLTGEENWEQQSGQTADYFRISNMAALPSKVFCTHFLSPDTDINYASTVTGIKMQQSSSYGVILACRPPNVTGLANFKSFLATQYANGTPVTVWYVLATEETAVVNEPLMRIGDYADTLSNISIPVTAGGDTLSVDTTVQPSEVSVNYKGWHPVADVHERENGAWT